MVVSFEEAKSLIEEADLLLFRAGGFPSIGWGITRYTGGKHSHVALAHYDDDELYCVEQREFKGGRSVLLESQIQNRPIDVYRASPEIMIPHRNGDLTWKKKYLDDATKKRITKTALKITGSDYGWSNIWGIFKGYAPGFRLLKTNKNGDEDIAKAYVCSTVPVYSYRINYYDPCPNLSDARTTPTDLAQSALFHYMFTIGPKDV